jgi:hypothetical protein
MGILLLAIFVVGSLVFSFWAWRSYGAITQESVGQDDTDPLVIIAVIAILGGGLPEVLHHYTKWPFALRVGLSIAFIVVAQYLAFRVLNGLRRKIQDGRGARPSVPNAQS